MEKQYQPTLYDEAMQTRQLQMIKSIVPYLDVSKRQQAALIIQSLEWRNAMNVFSGNSNALSACEVPDGTDRRTAILTAVREYCTPKEQETIDTLLNLFCIMENYESMI